MGTMYITVGDVTLETATVRKALSPRQREALAYTLQGYKQREIAEHMGCSQGRVSQLVQAARHNLSKARASL